MRAGLRACALVFALAVAGCGTPKEVRQLSTEVGSAVLKMAADMQKVAAAAKEQAEGRLETLDYLSRETIGMRTDLESQIGAARKAGEAAVKEFDDVKKFIAEQDALALKLETERKAAHDQAVKSQSTLAVPAGEFKKVTDDLAILGKKKDRWTRLKTTGAWITDVADRVKDAKEQADKAAANTAATK